MRQPDQVREITGPPKSVAYDDVGRPTRAAESFAQKQGVSLAQLYLIQTQRGECLAFKQVTKGRPSLAILQEILPKAISEIPWPRSMYWTGLKGPRFIRPIRWIVALLGGKVIHFHFGDVSSGDASAGHRFLGKPKIKIRGSHDYIKRLRENFVAGRPDRAPAENRIGVAQRGREGRRKGSPRCRPDGAGRLPQRIPEGPSRRIRSGVPRTARKRSWSP